MPKGTDPDGVLEASRAFAREEFALQHRYALVLHTDAGHPHVHLVVKAMGEDGQRLRVDKAKLRHWRESFATHLRTAGIAANATPARQRLRPTPKVRDGAYWAAWRRGTGLAPSVSVSPTTQAAFSMAWRAVALRLRRQGLERDAADMDQFARAAAREARRRTRSPNAPPAR